MILRYLEVWLQASRAGWLCEANGVTRFIASSDYFSDRQRQTLSLSMTVPGADRLTNSILSNRFDPAVYRERGELPPFFAGLLPEGPLRRRLAATRSQGTDMDDFGILAAAGEDLPGAVRIVPADLANLEPAALAYGADLGATGHQLGRPEQAAAGAASLAGVQDKLALLKDEDTGTYCLPTKGRLSDIVAKLPSQVDNDLISNEFACMQLAALAGVDVAQCHLAPAHSLSGQAELIRELGPETQFLAVRRFDRSLGQAIHMEDACQLLTLMPNQKYAGRTQFITLLRVLNRLGENGIDDIRQLFIRQAVNTLLGNSDAHLKNFSVLYRNGPYPILAPAYDIVCVAARRGFRGFSVNAEVDRLQRVETLDTYVSIAKEAGISERIARAAVKQTITQARDMWPAALRRLDMPIAIRSEISARLETLPLATSR